MEGGNEDDGPRGELYFLHGREVQQSQSSKSETQSSVLLLSHLSWMNMKVISAYMENTLKGEKALKQSPSCLILAHRKFCLNLYLCSKSAVTCLPQKILLDKYLHKVFFSLIGTLLSATLYLWVWTLQDGLPRKDCHSAASYMFGIN